MPTQVDTHTHTRTHTHTHTRARRHARTHTHTHTHSLFLKSLSFTLTHLICMQITGLNLNYCETTFMPGNAFTCAQLKWLINQLVCLLSDLICRACFTPVWSINISGSAQMKSKAWWFYIEGWVRCFMISTMNFLISRIDYEMLLCFGYHKSPAYTVVAIIMVNQVVHPSQLTTDMKPIWKFVFSFFISLYLN